MIHQATQWLKSILTGPAVGLPAGVVFESEDELQQHKRPPYAAIIIDEDERYQRVDRKDSYADYPEQNKRVYTIEALRAVLPVSVLLVEQDRPGLEELRRKFLAALPLRMKDAQGFDVGVTPRAGSLLEDRSVQRKGVAIDILIEFDAGIYRTEETPLFTQFETEVVIEKPGSEEV